MFVEKANLNPAFQHNEYVFRKKLFNLFGESFKVFDGNENLVLYSEQKVFTLKEDFRIYSDESKTIELLSLKADQIFGAGAEYNIHDSTTDKVIGSIRQEILKSILKLRSEWTFFSNDGQEIGKLTETSMTEAIRIFPFISILLQSYIINDLDGKKIAEIKQLPHFGSEYKMNIIEENPSIDRRLLISMGILLGIGGRISHVPPSMI